MNLSNGFSSQILFQIENSNQKLSEAIKTWKSNCHQYKLQFEEKSAHETSLLYQLKAKEGETRDLQRDIELLRNEIEKVKRKKNNSLNCINIFSK